MTTKKKLWIKAAAAILIALISFFVLGKMTTSPEFHEKTIASLDEKKTTVMELTAASTAASAAVTLIPGDTATPIADKLADLSTYFLVVLCALYLEKYLLTITGFAAFKILIPAACLIYLIGLFRESEFYRQLVAKLTLFGLAIVLVIPVSVGAGDMIQATYEASIENTIASAKEATQEIENSTEESQGAISSFFSKIKDGVAGAIDRAENILSDFVESLAIMIVTSCVIPVLVFVFFAWLVKAIWGIDVPMPKKKEKKKLIGANTEQMQQ